MKRVPKWRDIEEMMKPGRLTRDGMLGSDPRPLEEIIESDGATVARLGLTHGDIARRLEELTAASMERLGDPVIVEETYEVRVEEARGSLPCPFKHPGRWRKAVTYCRHLPTGESIAWTALGVHMIEAHGFYEGRGSPFRLDPERIARLLAPRASSEKADPAEHKRVPSPGAGRQTPGLRPDERNATG